jgi:LysR family hydrogen peroxide-inducible transcriptional activator
MMVKKLEGELGVKIFDKGHPLKPSPSGEIIISRARQILQEIKNLKEFIRTEKDSIRRRISPRRDSNACPIRFAPVPE